MLEAVVRVSSQRLAGDGAASDADSEGAVGDAPGDGEADDAGGEVAAGDAGGDGAVVLGMVGALEVMPWFLLEDPGKENIIEVGGGYGEGAVGDALDDDAAGDAAGDGGSGAARVMVPLVMLMVRVLQVVVLGVGPRVGDHLPVLGVGPRHSWRRALGALLAGLSAGPGGVCCLPFWSGSSPILAEGVAGNVDGEGPACDATVYSVSGALGTRFAQVELHRNFDVCTQLHYIFASCAELNCSCTVESLSNRAGAAIAPTAVAAAF